MFMIWSWSWNNALVLCTVLFFNDSFGSHSEVRMIYGNPLLLYPELKVTMGVRNLHRFIGITVGCSGGKISFQQEWYLLFLTGQIDHQFCASVFVSKWFNLNLWYLPIYYSYKLFRLEVYDMSMFMLLFFVMCFFNSIWMLFFNPFLPRRPHYYMVPLCKGSVTCYY